MIDMQVSMDKQYRTRDGKPVKLLCVDRQSNFPVIGLVKDNTAFEQIYMWRADGTGSPERSCSPTDLIEVKPRIKREMWVNVYDNGHIAFQTRKAADINAFPGRLACVKVEIDCEEGEGL